ncbi:MAG: hypothetical protein ABW321_35085 [Polyangiales bacterium]
MSVWWQSLDAARVLPVLWGLSQRLTALAVLLQAAEWLQVRASFADAGTWRYALLAPEHRVLPKPLRWLCAASLPYRPFVGLLVLRLLAAGWWLLGGSVLLAPLLFVGQLLVCIRFRGTSNGGSDAMTLVLLLAHSVAALGGTELACRVALLYIAVQVTLSYLIAGLVKLRQADWRQGRALCHFVSASAYPAPRWLTRLLARPALAAPLACGVIAFESLAPLAWLDPRVCAVFLAAGACFHALNAYVFGLNRFFWAWLAGYPALAYGCLYLAETSSRGT